MGNYADNKDRMREEYQARQKAEKEQKTGMTTTKEGGSLQTAESIYNARGGYSGTGMSLNDFKQKGNLSESDAGAGSGSQSVRRRGSSEQQRVGQDTRVRGDEGSGMGGAAGSSIGQAMSQAAGAPATQQTTSTGLWQGTRQATDLASIQQRVLQSLTKPMQRGQ